MFLNTSPNSFTFLVLADIHFGNSDDAPEFNVPSESSLKEDKQQSNNRLQALINTVKTTSPLPTAILVLGDLTSSALPSEFCECKKLVHHIADELNISHEKIFFTYGNHDVDWRICKLSQQKEHNRDKYYNYIAACTGGILWGCEKTSLCLELGPVIGSGVFEVDAHRIFILNSGWSCTNEQIFPHGRLGEKQFQWFQEALSNYKSLDGWNIVMSHHHAHGYAYPTPCLDISCLEEGADLLQLMGNEGIDIFCHGHRHHAIAETIIKDTWEKPITFFCAGSVAANSKDRSNGKIPNLFHIICLNKRIESKAAIGYIRSYKYGLGGWNEIQHADETPLNYEHWFGIPNAVQAMDENIKNFFLSKINNSLDMVELPAREELPLELKCCPLPLLNEKSQTIAYSLGYKLMGQWGPKNFVALIKRK